MQFKKVIMRNLILSLAIVATAANTIQAQDSTLKNDWRNSVLYGVKAGGNVSSVYNRSEENFLASSVYGFAGGVFVSIPIDKWYGFQPELVFSQRGFHGEGTLDSMPFSVTRKTAFIDLPILFSVKPGKYFTLLAGPQFSYLVSHSNTFDSNAPGQEKQFDNEDMRRMILCFTGGLDVNVKHFVLGVRGGWDITRGYDKVTSGLLTYRNMWSQATLGYRF
jgi:hypothetical protein